MNAHAEGGAPAPDDLTRMSVRDFAAATASKAPIPGGGSVAGVVGAMGAALGEMALAFTRGKKKYADHAEAHQGLAVRLARARGMYADLTAEDARAYLLYQEASRLEGPGRDEKMQTALVAAINVPREMTALSISVLDALVDLGGCCNPHLLSDLGAAAVLAEAVVRLCDLNVRVNAAGVADEQAGKEIRQVSARDCDRAAELRAKVEAIVSQRL
jgi:formiminotetrahydrofolate cyclodeaminase